MQKSACSSCQKEFSMNNTYLIKGAVFCETCGNEFLGKNKDIPPEAITRQMDKTLCSICGKDNGNLRFREISGIPLCLECEAIARNRPFPKWIKISLTSVIFLVIFSFVWNLRFIEAYFSLKQSYKAIAEGKIERAVELANKASQKVPEDKNLKALSAYYAGMLAMKNDDNEKALSLFESCREAIPAEHLDPLIAQARIGLAFNNRDYDTFMTISKELSDKNPEGAYYQAQLASAYACKYAVTGDLQYKNSSLECLAAVDKMPTKGPAQDVEYKQRILYRLQTREIISPEEFHKRFPNGWKISEGAQ